MLTQIKRSVILAILFALVLGLAYPLLEVGLANALFGHQATGSLGPNGSTLIGQPFAGTHWFHGRPDAYNDTETGGTNLEPRSRVLVEDTKKLVAWWHAHGVDPTQELVTTSASGVDPTSPHGVPWCRSRWWRARPGCHPRPSPRSSSTTPRGPSTASSGSGWSTC